MVQTGVLPKDGGVSHSICLNRLIFGSGLAALAATGERKAHQYDPKISTRVQGMFSCPPSAEWHSDFDNLILS